MWWLKSLKSVNTQNNGVKAFLDVCLTKTGKSQFYSWTLLLTSCEIQHKPSWCSKPLLYYLYNGNNNIHLLCLSRTVYPKELWRVELCRCVVALSPIGMFCCLRVFFLHIGAAQWSVFLCGSKLRALQNSSGLFIWERWITKPKKETLLWGKKKIHMALKKKKKLKHSFGGSWSPGCSPLGAVLSTMSPIQESPVPLQQMQIMHWRWWKRCLKIIHLFLERGGGKIN